MIPFNDYYEGKEKIEKLLDGNQLIMFFRSGKSLFGSPEESRIIFSKLKDENDDKTWKDQAKFGAIDLIRALKGEDITNLFGLKDIGNINILDKDHIMKMLLGGKHVAI